jgi:adenosylcobinamide-GDP ribazoletransferase
VVRPDELRFAVLTALLALVPLLVISASSAIAGLALGIAAAALLARWLCRLLGGYTGDVLGAVEQAFEITFLLSVAALLK